MECVVKAPANIAFIKYWGKRNKDKQWPANDSLSMTLSRSYTQTAARPSTSQTHEVFYANHQLFPTDPFAKKIFAHLKRMGTELGFEEPLRVETQNSFPTACGLASSASGFAALTIAALAAWTRSKNLQTLDSKGFDAQRISHWARLGSGSACRSVLGGYVQWSCGTAPEQQSVKSVASAQDWKLHDIIVMLNAKPKAQPSSNGHEAASTSPLFDLRVAGVAQRLEEVTKAIATRDLARLGTLCETDALEMHAVMMTSKPSFQYLSPLTIEFLTWLRQTRNQGNLNAYFTLDAGPNPHILCEPRDLDHVVGAIASRFPSHEILIDFVGEGPTLEISELTQDSVQGSAKS